MDAADNAFQGSFFYQVLQMQPQMRACKILGSKKKQKDQML